MIEKLVLRSRWSLSAAGVAAPLVLPALLAATHPPALAAAPVPVRRVEFNRDIRPILSDKCFACHGPDANHRKAGLRLDTEEGAKALRGGRQALVPGKPEASSLLTRAIHPKAALRMPPASTGKKLTTAELEVLRLWIAQGGTYQKHWSFISPRTPALPAVKDAAWVRNPVDRFILAKLEANGLRPSPEADRTTLIRRLSFDLTGLPPTPQEVDAFLADRRPDAYEQLVDRLLASPRYGERMAIYWLDLVRYADTVGYHGDQEHNISPYRDYVIQAFNDNMPFDRFTTEQLAGDLLPNATTKQKIATGYNRLLQTTHEGGAQDKEYLAKYSADRVRNLSGVWMGATVGCAECHDHKYDPYSQKDFYSLAAFFADIQEKGAYAGPDGNPTVRPPEIDVISPFDQEEIARLRTRLVELEKQVVKGPENGAGAAELRERIAALEKRKQRIMVTVSGPRRTIRVLKRGDWMDETGEVVQPAVPHFLKPIGVKDAPLTRLDLARWLTSPDHPQTARVFTNRMWYLFFGAGLSRGLEDTGSQGDWPTHPELLDYLAVSFAAGNNLTPPAPLSGTERGEAPRTTLVRGADVPKYALHNTQYAATAARQPVSATTSTSSWNVKALVRLIVTSAAYRQSSAVRAALQERDPENRLFARQGRFRLPAEMIRDNALYTSGLLIERLGGKSARPYQPEGYYALLNFPKRTYKHDTDDGQYRRGVYTHWQRQYLHPALRAFDAPSREECTAQRPITNTPLAALTLLNDPSYVEAARVFAARALKEGGATDSERVRWAWRVAVSRPANEREASVLLGLLEKNRARYQQDPPAAEELLKVGMAPKPADQNPAEVAAWTAVTRALLNLSETITRN